MAEREQEVMEVGLLSESDNETGRAFLCEQFGAVSAAMWRWFFRDNPHGDSFISLAKIEGRPVGINGLVQRGMVHRGVRRKAAQDSYLVTHSGFRRRGIMRKVVTCGWNAAEKLGIDAIFIFQAADNASLPGFVRCGGENLGRVGQKIRVLDAAYLVRRKLGNDLLATIVAAPLNLILRLLEPSSAASRDLRIEPVTAFDERFTALWEGIAHRFEAALVRDAAWLEYRYLKHPEKSYKAIALVGGNALEGYAIMEHRPGAGGAPPKTMLVDFIASSERAARRLLAGVFDEARKHSSVAVHTWVPRSSPWRSVFERAAFLEQKGVHCVLVQRITPGCEPLMNVTLSNWYLSMGDSDLY